MQNFSIQQFIIYLYEDGDEDCQTGMIEFMRMLELFLPCWAGHIHTYNITTYYIHSIT